MAKRQNEEPAIEAKSVSTCGDCVYSYDWDGEKCRCSYVGERSLKDEACKEHFEARRK